MGLLLVKNKSDKLPTGIDTFIPKSKLVIRFMSHFIGKLIETLSVSRASLTLPSDVIKD